MAPLWGMAPPFRNPKYDILTKIIILLLKLLYYYFIIDNYDIFDHILQNLNDFPAGNQNVHLIIGDFNGHNAIWAPSAPTTRSGERL